MRAVSRPKYSSRLRSLILRPPLPSLKLTRATEVLRRPVAENTFCAMTLLLRSNRERLGVLRRVRMLAAGVDFEFRAKLATQAALGQHSLDREPDERLRLIRQHLLC